MGIREDFEKAYDGTVLLKSHRESALWAAKWMADKLASECRGIGRYGDGIQTISKDMILKLAKEME